MGGILKNFLNRFIILCLILVPFTSLHSYEQKNQFYGDDAKFVYQLLNNDNKRAKEEKGENDGEKVMRVTAVRLLCTFLIAPDGPVYKWDIYVNGERQPRTIGGLEGGDKLYELVGKVFGITSGSLSASALQCVKFPPFEKPTYGCVVLP